MKQASLETHIAAFPGRACRDGIEVIVTNLCFLTESHFVLHLYMYQPLSLGLLGSVGSFLSEKVIAIANYLHRIALDGLDGDEEPRVELAVSVIDDDR